MDEPSISRRLPLFEQLLANKDIQLLAEQSFVARFDANWSSPENSTNDFNITLTIELIS
ncbi:unnamed protein product, partial [Rotaria sp. Silwood1]